MRGILRKNKQPVSKLTLKKKFPYSFELCMEDDIDLYNKFDRVVEVEAKTIRDPKTHARYFAMLNLAFNSQERMQDRNRFREYVQIQAGYYNPLIIDGQEVAKFPKSINFATLKEVPFKELCNKVRGVLIREFDFGPEIDNEIANFNY